MCAAALSEISRRTLSEQLHEKLSVCSWVQDAPVDERRSFQAAGALFGEYAASLIHDLGGMLAAW